MALREKGNASHSAPTPPMVSPPASGLFQLSRRHIPALGVLSQGHSFIYTFCLFWNKKETTLHLFVPPDQILPVLASSLHLLSLAEGDIVWLVFLGLFLRKGGVRWQRWHLLAPLGPPPEPERLSGNQSHAAGFISDQPVS